MTISLEHISKKFQRHWIFKDINFTFTSPGKYALLGANGSGKSTLLRIIAGMQSATVGKLHYAVDGHKVPTDKVFDMVSFAAPGQDIVDEFTFKEFLEFHFIFKKKLPELSIDDIIKLTGLEKDANKPIADYSSGMQQRVKLAQAIFSDTPFLFLDEPCSNLDQKGVEQYTEWIERYTNDRLVIVASNDVREYFFCKEHIEVEDYK